MMWRWRGRMGLDVAIVAGDEDNLKLTFPGDFAAAEAILKGRQMDLRWMRGQWL